MQVSVADLPMSGEEILSPVKDFMRQVAEKMGKQQENLRSYVSILEENMIDTIKSLS